MLKKSLWLKLIALSVLFFATFGPEFRQPVSASCSEEAVSFDDGECGCAGTDNYRIYCEIRSHCEPCSGTPVCIPQCTNLCVSGACA